MAHFDQLMEQQVKHMASLDATLAKAKSSRKIVTSHQYPPIPIRSYDWLAYFEGDEEGPQGWGPTEEAAIADLIENYDEPEESRVGDTPIMVGRAA